MNERTPKRSELASIEELAAAHGISERKAWDVVKAGKLDRWRIPGEGKRNYFEKKAFARAMAAPVRVQTNAPIP